jgi:RNA-directed DNA polymerase
MYQITQDLNRYLQGWVGYSGIQESKKLFGDLDGWIRNRLRSMQLKKWKNLHKFQRIMITSDFKRQEAHKIWIRMNKWQSVHRRAVRFVMDLKWFRKQDLIVLNDFTKRFLEQSLFSC